MSGFQGILGRLNGKSVTEVKKEEATRRDVQLRLYTGQRYGFLNFVSGGFLVGDTIKRDNPSERDAQPSMWLDSIEEPHKLLPKSSKRKRAAEGENNAAGFKIHAKRLKKATDHGSDEEMEKAPEAFDEGDIPQEPEVRSKKTKMRAERRALNDARRAKKEEREQRKAGKEARKEERRQRREERRQRRLTKQGKERNETGQEEAEPEPNPVSADATSAQVLSSRASPYGRQALRKRYIQQKKMASLDTQALKEVGCPPSLIKTSQLTKPRFLWARRSVTGRLASIARGVFVVLLRLPFMVDGNLVLPF